MKPQQVKVTRVPNGTKKWKKFGLYRLTPKKCPESKLSFLA